MDKNTDYNKLAELYGMCHGVQCFEVEGRIFKGYYGDTVKQYMKENLKNKIPKIKSFIVREKVVRF